MMKKTLFIFRRDLRIEDNIGLNFALENSDKVIPCFIFTPEQIEKNSYLSRRCLQFMIESLEELDESLRERGGKLYFFYGEPEKIVAQCIEKLDVDGVIFNRDYTPYSQKRDKQIEGVCKKKKAAFHSFDDALLHPPEETLKRDGKPYTIFTPYFRNALHLAVPRPKTYRGGRLEQGKIEFSKEKSILHKILPKREKQMPGGRSEGMKILRGLKKYHAYAKERDFPSLGSTTHLSAHLKFTTCSPREIYHSMEEHLGKHAELLRALYWRDFFTSIAYFFPKVFGHAFHLKFDKVKWKPSKSLFQKWCDGKTGFPIVDAGMREMNETGFMHNRVRMIVATFLIKDLHIDWQWGEKYFAQKLIDYDPAVNNGNWQWSASTGCDAQPYFRIFNPWAQQEKFDKECLYIKKWVPELAKVVPKRIHRWFEEEQETGYPLPIVDHAEEAKKTLAIYTARKKK